jgi:hypothetical protein
MQVVNRLGVIKFIGMKGRKGEREKGRKGEGEGKVKS